MLTTGRVREESYTREEARSSLGLLEREPVSFDDYTSIPEVQNESTNERQRMSRNLSRILNYEQFANAPVMEEAEIAEMKAKTVEQPVKEEKKEETPDFMPSLTTMQFKNANVESFKNEMQHEEKISYKLNAKGKAILAFYIAAVLAIVALIILNTTVLANLRASKAAYAVEYNQLLAETEALQLEKEELESIQNITEKAEELGMIIE